MKFLRENRVIKGIVKESRKTAVGSTNAFSTDIYTKRYTTPHEEMKEVMRAMDNNTFFESAVNTATNFIMGEGIEFESDDEVSKNLVEKWFIDNLNGEVIMEEAIRHAVSTGNGYVEQDVLDPRVTGGLLIPSKFYPIVDSSSMYINSDVFGNPKRSKIVIPTGETKEVDNLKEYYIQEVNRNMRIPGARDFYLDYFSSSTSVFGGKNYIYGIPVDKRKIIHFKINFGRSGLYGRSQLASAINDNEILWEIERSIAVLAKYKAVPRNIIQYGNSDMPATEDELDEFVVYLESLDKEEDAIINKPLVKTEMANAGKDINLDYMITHIKKKMIAGLAPDFLTGMGQDVNRATAQQELMAYILAIYAKRKVFIRLMQETWINPFLKWKGLKPVKIKFSELDFETPIERESRARANFLANGITLDEFRKELYKPKFPKNRDSSNEGEMLFGELQTKFIGNFSDFSNDIEDNFSDPKELGGGNSSPNPLISSSPEAIKETKSGYVRDPTGTAKFQNELKKQIINGYRERLKNVLERLKQNKVQIENFIKTEATIGVEAIDIISAGLLGVADDLLPIVNSILTRSWLKGNNDIAKDLKISQGFVPFDKRILNALSKNSLSYLKKLSIEKEADLRRILTEGVTQGDSISSISKEIRDAFSTTAHRAKTIARTEVIKIYNQSSKEAMVKSGTRKYKWITAMDDLVRDPKAKDGHRLLHNRVFEFGKRGMIPYSQGGKKGQIPASPIPGQLGKAEYDINCFIDPQVPILTSQGYKHIGKIKIGDKVLTHTGKFRKVTKLLENKKYKGEVIKIGVGWKYTTKQQEKEETITVTPEHPILTSKGWKKACDLNKYDKIIVSAEHCKNCGELHPLLFYRNKNKFCSSQCASKYNATKQYKDEYQHTIRSIKASKQMYREYANGTRDKYKITEKANKKCREMVANGNWILQKDLNRTGVPRTKEVKEKISYKNSLQRYKDEGIEYLTYENKFKGVLEKLNINYEWHRRIDNYEVDFYLPEYNLIIEIDEHVKNSKYDKEREQHLKNQKHSILRIMNTQIEILEQIDLNPINNFYDLIGEAQKISMNHLGLYDFMELEISSIKKWVLQSSKKLYNFAVDKDESYIAKGIVTHNCRCRIIPQIDIPKERLLKESMKKYISYKTLSTDFAHIFNEPRTTEVYFLTLEDGWKISFNYHNVDIVCKVMIKDLMEELKIPKEEINKEILETLIRNFKNKYLIKAIKEEV